MSSNHASDLLTKPKKTAQLFRPRRAVIIGCGGIGSHLWDFIAQEMWARVELNKDPAMLYHQRRNVVNEYLLIDNDTVEMKNLFRQSYFPEHVGTSKAEALASKYKGALEATGEITVNTQQTWIDENSNIFRNGDAVLLCVDNHATRKMVNDLLKPGNAVFDSILISGGNTDTLVTVQTMVVKRNNIRTASLEHMHPDITNPEDKHPRDVACTDRTAAINDPQLFRANLMAATQMFQIFMNAVDNKKIDYCELWMDVATQSYRKVDIPEKEIIENA